MYTQEKKSNNPSLDEVSLFDLLKGLWIQRWLILIVAGFMFFGAGIYAFLSKPIYEARAYVLPPSESEIGDLNYGRTAESELKPYSVKDVYAVFVRNLQSESLRHEFFNEVYLPSLSDSDRKIPKGALFRQFSSDLTIVQPSKEFDDRFSVAIRDRQPSEAADWLRIYVERASLTTKKELIKNISKEIKVRAHNIETQISMLRESATDSRRDTVLQLQEAEKVASAIGLKEHVTVSGTVTGEMSGATDPRLIYLRGTEALEAEVKALQERQSDDAFISDLRRLQGLHEFYNSLTVKADDVAVYRLDGVIQPPDSPIKPNKAMILMFGLVGGLFLGVFLGVIRYFWKKSKC